MRKTENATLDEFAAWEEAQANPRAELAVEDTLDDFGDLFALGYEANEELYCGTKEFDRDRHRWELDPASAEDYRDRVRFGEAWRWRHFGH